MEPTQIKDGHDSGQINTTPGVSVPRFRILLLGHPIILSGLGLLSSLAGNKPHNGTFDFRKETSISGHLCEVFVTEVYASCWKPQRTDYDIVLLQLDDNAEVFLKYRLPYLRRSIPGATYATFGRPNMSAILDDVQNIEGNLEKWTKAQLLSQLGKKHEINDVDSQLTPKHTGRWLRAARSIKNMKIFRPSRKLSGTSRPKTADISSTDHNQHPPPPPFSHSPSGSILSIQCVGSTCTQNSDEERLSDDANCSHQDTAPDGSIQTLTADSLTLELSTTDDLILPGGARTTRSLPASDNDLIPPRSTSIQSGTPPLRAAWNTSGMKNSSTTYLVQHSRSALQKHNVYR